MTFLYGAFGVFALLIIIALCTKRSIKDNVYVCPNCKTRFKPSRRKNSYFGNMSNTSEILKCPCCTKITICSLSNDQVKI